MFSKFFSFDKKEGKIALHLVDMGARDCWILRNRQTGFLEFGLDYCLEHGVIHVDNGKYSLELIAIFDSYNVLLSIDFEVKDNQVSILDIVYSDDVCKEKHFSIMPEKGIYNL